MKVRCPCGPYLIEANPEHSTYVRDGVPMCNERTCQAVREHRGLSPIFDNGQPDESIVHEHI